MAAAATSTMTTMSKIVVFFIAKSLWLSTIDARHALVRLRPRLVWSLVQATRPAPHAPDQLTLRAQGEGS